MYHGVDKVFTSFLTTVGTLAANKKVVGSWLVALTMSVGAIGDKVYVERTAELAVIQSQLTTIQKTLDKMDVTLEKNGTMLQSLLVEQARVQTELAAHERASAAAAKSVRR